jgi:actin-like ATPase involved in cell morphogenesis
MTGWQLGIDFGTSSTVAAVKRDENLAVVDVESNGSSRLPSSVYLTEDNQILVGTAALHQAVFGPDRFEPTPKRAIGEGEIFLGDRLVPVTELVAAIFRRVYTETCRQQGETTPSAVHITHPADWSSARLSVLTEALEQAGIASAVLLPEPVAAAARIASETPDGRHIAVYDFGGGTFDAAVLFRSASTFTVAGPPAGRDPLGGEDIDQRIITYLGTVVGETDEGWLALINPADVKSRRNAAGLRLEVQRAKETLSEVSSCQLWIPGLERDLQLTRTELEGLIAADIDATVDTLETALSDANVAAADLAGIYLVGGSSRIPVVADTIWRRLGVQPAVQDNPKSVVALGAASWAQAPSTATAPTPPAGGRGLDDVSTTEPTLLVRAPSGDNPLFRAYLAADVSSAPWPAGSVGYVQLVVNRPGSSPATIRARDEPTQARNSSELAEQIRSFRVSRTPGYRDVSFAHTAVFGQPEGIERRFLMSTQAGEVNMVERYLVVDGRAYVLAAPEAGLSLADGVVLGAPPKPGLFASRFEFPYGPEWTPTEQVVVRRNGTPYSVLTEHTRLWELTTTEAWLARRLAELQKGLAQPSVAGRSPGRVLGGFDGEIATIRWVNRGSPMLTKVGVAVAGPEAFTVVIALPHQEQNQFASLARQVGLNPTVVRAPV